MDKPKLAVSFDDSIIFQQQIIDALEAKYEVFVDPKHPDISFYGNFGWKHLTRKDSIKVFVSA